MQPRWKVSGRGTEGKGGTRGLNELATVLLMMGYLHRCWGTRASAEHQLCHELHTTSNNTVSGKERGQQRAPFFFAPDSRRSRSLRNASTSLQQQSTARMANGQQTVSVLLTTKQEYNQLHYGRSNQHLSSSGESATEKRRATATTAIKTTRITSNRSAYFFVKDEAALRNDFFASPSGCGGANMTTSEVDAVVFD